MSSAQTTHPFTCNTCQVAFRSSDVQRAHMQTDWHRYNLKRRVASLPPLSSEVFAEKVLANKATAAASAAKASFEKTCTPCHKTYYSENAYNNHVASNKHKSALLAARRKPGKTGVDEDATSIMSSTFSLGETAETSSVATEVNGSPEKDFEEIVDKIKDTSLEDSDPIPQRPARPHHSQAPADVKSTASDSTEGRDATKAYKDRIKTCLFCNTLSDSIPANIDHMAKGHGMFIPEQAYLVNLEGLINYLFEKIHEFRECIWCGKTSSSAYGVQTHMRDSGHCKIAYATEEEQLEIGDYYDFRASYSDNEDFEDEDVEMSDADNATGGVKLGASRASRIVVDDNTTGSEAEEDGEGWETDSTVSSVPSDELGKVYVDSKDQLYNKLPSSRHHSHADQRPRRNRDGFHSRAHPVPHAVYHDDFELHLPSGRTAGHRTLNKYFKQNLRNRPVTLEEKLEARRIADAELAARASSAMDVDGDSDAGSGAEGGERGRSRQLITRANGGMGMVGVTEAKKKEVVAVEKREKKREQRDRAKQQWFSDKQGNLQKHFRDPLLQ